MKVHMFDGDSTNKVEELNTIQSRNLTDMLEVSGGGLYMGRNCVSNEPGQSVGLLGIAVCSFLKE